MVPLPVGGDEQPGASVVEGASASSLLWPLAVAVIWLSSAAAAPNAAADAVVVMDPRANNSRNIFALFKRDMCAAFNELLISAAVPAAAVAGRVRSRRMHERKHYGYH